MASEKVTAMIEEVKALSVLELAELVHALEETFGVSAAAAAAPQGVHHPDGQEDRHGSQHRHAGQAQDLAQQPLAPGVPILLILHRDILSLRQSGDAGRKAGAIHPAEFSQLFIVTESMGKVKSFAAFRESMGIS